MAALRPALLLAAGLAAVGAAGPGAAAAAGPAALGKGPLALAAAGPVAAVAARPAPPFHVGRPAVDDRRVPAGARLSLAATVRPTGTRPQRRVIVAFLLSRDRRRDAGDRVLAKRRITRLGRRPRRVRAHPRLPAGLSGRWHLLVCAGQRPYYPRRARRCRAASRPLAVARPGAHDPGRRARPPAPAPGPALPSAPRFLGIAEAGIVTCDEDLVEFELAWQPAIDDLTPPEEIVYEVFQATGPGAQDFARPAYVTEPGAESLTTPPLRAGPGYWFAVRARDADGNRDPNVFELPGDTCTP